MDVLGSFGTIFVDQSFWQCGVAASPRNGVWGFMFGGLAWIALPLVFATTMGLGYLALCSQRGAPLLDNVALSQGIRAVQRWTNGHCIVFPIRHIYIALLQA